MEAADNGNSAGAGTEAFGNNATAKAMLRRMANRNSRKGPPGENISRILRLPIVQGYFAAAGNAGNRPMSRESC